VYAKEYSKNHDVDFMIFGKAVPIGAGRVGSGIWLQVVEE
jgi:hypothetical protein